MNTSFRRDLQTSCMVIEDSFEQNMETSFQIGMLRHNTLPCLLPLQTEEVDGTLRFLYDISGLQSFARIYEVEKLSFRVLKELLLSFRTLSSSLADHLLDSEGILFREEYIFTDLSRNRFFYCYVPGHAEDSAREIRQLCQQFLSQIDYDDREAVSLAFSLSRQTQGEHFTLTSLAGLAQEDLVREGRTQKGFTQESPAQERPQPEDDLLKEDAADMTPENMFKEPPAPPATKPDLRFSEKVRIYLHGRKLRDVLNDLNDGKLLSKIRACRAPVTLPEEVPPAAYDLTDQDSSDPIFLSEEIEFLDLPPSPAPPPASAGTVILSRRPAYHRLSGLESQQGVQCELRSFPFTIGKLRGQCGLLLDEPTVSRMHGRIYAEPSPEGEKYYYEDLNSTNGSSINGQKVEAYTRRQIHPGDKLGFAGEEFCFR